MGAFPSLCLMMETDTAFEVYFKKTSRCRTVSKIIVVLTGSEPLCMFQKFNFSRYLQWDIGF
jgi:hypothetical protein